MGPGSVRSSHVRRQALPMAPLLEVSIRNHKGTRVRMLELEDHPAPGGERPQERQRLAPSLSFGQWQSQGRNPGLLHPGHFSLHSSTLSPSESRRSRSTLNASLSSGEMSRAPGKWEVLCTQVSHSKFLKFKVKCGDLWSVGGLLLHVSAKGKENTLRLLREKTLPWNCPEMLSGSMV